MCIRDRLTTRPHSRPHPSVQLELMRGNSPVWTVPGSPASGPLFQTKMPDFEPEDGMYHLRATSMLHHQAFDISREFEVTDRSGPPGACETRTNGAPRCMYSWASTRLVGSSSKRSHVSSFGQNIPGIHLKMANPVGRTERLNYHIPDC